MILWRAATRACSIWVVCLGSAMAAAGSQRVGVSADAGEAGQLIPAPARPPARGPRESSGWATGQIPIEFDMQPAGRKYVFGPPMASAGWRRPDMPRLLNACRLTAGPGRAIVILVNNEPFNPADEMIAWTGATDQVIHFYQSRAAKDPNDPRNYSSLGAAYVQKTRETGDVAYYDLAEKALKHALTLRPDDRTLTTVTTRLALVSLARHQFPEALAHARKALDSGTGQLFPYAIAGDAHLETGEYDKAAEAYSRMATLQGAAYPHSRLAALRFLRGDLAGAIGEMEGGVEALLVGKAPRENVAWAETRLGELYFHAGDLPNAETAYRNALRSYAEYHRALAGLARTRAAQQSYAEAVSLYQKALGIIPLPEYAGALGDVYTKLGRLREARKQYALVEYIGYLNKVNKVIYNRELALFYADHDLKLKQALELAQRELKVRRDIYTHDILAWALYKNGKARDALAAMAEALRLGTRDAQLFFHAGLIHQATGDADKAREYLERALAANPYFHLLHADVARRALQDLGGRPGRP